MVGGHTGPCGKHVISLVVGEIVHGSVGVHILPPLVAAMTVKDLGTRHEAATKTHVLVK